MIKIKMSDHQEDITFMTMYEPQMEKAMAPTPVLLPGKSHGWRSLAGYSPQRHKELDTAEHALDGQMDVLDGWMGTIFETMRNN